MKNTIIRAIEQLDKGAKYYVRYLGMLRLMEAIFSSIYVGSAKSWEDNIFSALDTLTPRESKLLRLRLGLDDGNFRTLGEVADMFSVTRERIRQVEARAFRKLKHPTRRLVLLGWNWQNAYNEVERINKLQTAKTKEAKKIEKTTSKNAVSVDSLDLPTRVINSLLKAGYETVEQIKKQSDNELLQIQGLGHKSIFDIKAALHK